MIVVTCSGMSLGKAIWVRPDMDGLVASHDLIRILPDESAAPPGYVYAFLASRHGHLEIRRRIYGGSIKHIEPAQLFELLVPRLGKKIESRVHKMVVQGAALLSQYRLTCTAATSQLFASVGLPEVSPYEWHSAGPDLGFKQMFPRVPSARALNYNPRFKRLVQQIKKGDWKRLGDICVPGTLRRGNRFKQVDATPEHAYKLIGQRDLFALQPDGRWIAKWATGADAIVVPGTVLVAARGTLGEAELYCRAGFVWGKAITCAYSEDILRITADENTMPRGYLFAFMRSEAAFRMLRSISVGSKLQDHHYAFLPDLPIPCAPDDVQQAIHEMVVDAYEKRQKAVALYAKAVQEVEQALRGAA